MNKETIKQIVEDYFEIKIDTQTRKREYTEARAMYFKLTRDNTRLSLTAIGQDMNRHYSSVLHSIRQLNTWMETDSMIRNNYTILKNKLKDVEEDTEEILISKESVVLQFATLKDEVKQQRETIEQMKADYDELYEKHTKRERFYAKYGFID